VNTTHWQVTAKCTGCTSWGDDDQGITTLDPTQQNPLAFAYSEIAPETPASNASSFGIHDSIGHWYHDFAQGVNPGFAGLVAKNSGGAGSSTSTAAMGGSTGTVSSTTLTAPTPTTPAATATATSSSATAAPTDSCDA
jgi:hypothetical protein